MVVNVSQEEEIDEGFDEDYGEEDGAAMINENPNKLVRSTTNNYSKSSLTKQRKQKKQPTTTTRVKSHGCGKDDYEYA